MRHIPSLGVDSDLNHAITRYYRAQEAREAKNPRACYNPNALAIALGRVQEIAERVAHGADLGAEIQVGLNDRLRDYVLKYMRDRGHAV